MPLCPQTLFIFMLVWFGIQCNLIFFGVTVSSEMFILILKMSGYGQMCLWLFREVRILRLSLKITQLVLLMQYVSINAQAFKIATFSTIKIDV